MSLSDSCFDFLVFARQSQPEDFMDRFRRDAPQPTAMQACDPQVRLRAARKLHDNCDHYADPVFGYGVELDQLRAAVKRLIERPEDDAAFASLVFAARAVMRYHDSLWTQTES